MAIPIVSAESVVINEIMYNPTCNDNYCEWIELYNPTNESVDLINWTLCGDPLMSGFINHSDSNLYLDTGNILEPKSYAIVTDGRSGTDVYDEFNVSVNSMSLHVDASGICKGLSNTNGTLYLNDSNGVVDQISYYEAMGADGNNRSLERLNNTLFESLTDNGTPGFRNSISYNFSVNSTYMNYTNGSDPSTETNNTYDIVNITKNRKEENVYINNSGNFENFYLIVVEYNGGRDNPIEIKNAFFDGISLNSEVNENINNSNDENVTTNQTANETSNETNSSLETDYSISGSVVENNQENGILYFISLFLKAFFL